MSTTTSDGHSWTAQSGLREGKFECEGVISPPLHLKDFEDFVYDVIVIGAGYAGLCAARDLATAGRYVLLIEARDRVGGRTYTVTEDGFKFEMGGTWVYHTQNHTFRELLRYNLDRDLKKTRQTGHAKDYFTLNFDGCKTRDVSHAEAGKLAEKGWNLFLNVDGTGGRKACQLPHAQLGNVQVSRAEVEKWDSLSCHDRFEEIKDQLTVEEAGLLLTTILIISGGAHDMKDFSLWDMIHAHALNGHSFDNLEEIWFLYKLRMGQSHLARKIFDEAAEFGMNYAFNSPVDLIQQKTGTTQIRTQDGTWYKARKAICTAPLNVLKSLKFDPPLSPLRQEAVDAGHINFMTKIHAVVDGSGLASWTGACYPNNLVNAFGDGVLPSGDAHLVAFGTDERPHFVPEEHPEKVVEALEKFHPMDVKKLVFHNWNTDPYSQGGPAWWPPSYMSKYQDELQSRHGNVFFASADWAHGWRAFIDGALEQGFLSALTALRELRKEDGVGPST